MRNRSQNVTGEKVRSQKGRKPAPDRQKEAGESPDKKGITVDCHNLWGPGPVPSPWPEAMGREKNRRYIPLSRPGITAPPEKQGEGRKRRGAVGEGPGGLEPVAGEVGYDWADWESWQAMLPQWGMVANRAARGCPRRCGSNGSRWRGNAVRRRAVSKTVVGSSAPCTGKREKPNRTQTAPKQTEKRGKGPGKRGITENCHRE